MKKIALIAILLVANACGGSKSTETGDAQPTETTVAEPHESPETAPENVLPNDGTRAVGDVTKCPVSGDVFQVVATSPMVEHDGGTYYFCCKGCVKDFTADPAKFLAAGPVGDEQPDEEGAEPMPE